MKKLLLILLTTAVTSLQAQSYNFSGDYTSNGTPLYLETIGDNVSVETFTMIKSSLPESFPAPEYNHLKTVLII